MNTYMAMMAANAITYSASITLIVSTMLHIGRIRLVIANLTLVAAMVLLTPVIAHTWIVPPVLLTLLLYRKSVGMRDTLFYCLSAVFIIWIADALIASFFMYFAPDWHGGTGFNYLMCAVNLLIGIAVRAKPMLTQSFTRIRCNGFLVGLQLVIIVYFSLILPRYYTDLTTMVKRQIAVMTIPLMLFVFAIWLLTRKATRMEDESEERDRRDEIQRVYGKIINERFQSANIQRHYSLRMYQTIAAFISSQDMEGLTDYFKTHVSPIGEEIRGARREHLQCISNDLIRNLIENALSEATVSLPDITLDFSVSGIVSIPRHMEMDVFKILCIYIDNAFDALRDQAAGVFRIQAAGNAENVSCTIANTVTEAFDIKDLERIPAKWDEHGYGLNHVRKLSLRHPDMRISSFLTTRGGKKLLNQRIEIAI